MVVADNHSPEMGEKENVLKADTIYLLTRKKFNISCDFRAQWFLEHINRCIVVPPEAAITCADDTPDVEVLSVVPLETPLHWQPENTRRYRYLVTSQSRVVFLTSHYRMAFCIDMSPSASSVDIQLGEVMLDEIMVVLRKCIVGLIQPFIVPGSTKFFRPDIYVTVIAHTPFFASSAQQVLVQGWQISPENLDRFFSCVESQLTQLEDLVAEVTSIAHEQLEVMRAESEKLVGDLFEEEHSESLALSASANQIPMVGPDAGFINMLRYGLLALRLLPESSSSNLVVLTDAILCTPDVKVLDSVVTQLRTHSVSCSFIQLGSRFHPQCSLGQVPYPELLQYMACATQGSYITKSPQVDLSQTNSTLNFYHNAFLVWSFRRTNYEFSPPLPQAGEWNVSNHLFYGRREPQLLLKKQAEDKLNVSLQSLLCCRLRQGYTIKTVFIKDNQIELNLVLPWNSHIFIDYKVTAPWPGGQPVLYTLSIQAPYDFLHDITCLMKKPFSSPYRQLVVTRFWHTLKSLGQSDQLLVHLNTFLTLSANVIPESIRSGMPLFYLPAGAPGCPPVLASNEASCQQFSQFWRPLTLLDPTTWQRWLHTHNVVLILRHDEPLPRFLHVPIDSGRYQVVQCRQAAAALYGLLKDFSTFVLIENHSYVRFVGEMERPQHWFIIRVTSKPPCIVIQLSFLGGTEARERQKIVNELSAGIKKLSFPQRPQASVPPNCCVVLNKAVDKILIRYERMPSSLDTVVFPDGTKPSLGISFGTGVAPPPAGSLLTTLSRYLHHRRWVWAAHSGTHNPLSQEAVARVLSTLTKKRLREGFIFAHSTAGIINMILEVEMKQVEADGFDSEIPHQFCVIQYVLFPPHTTSTSMKDSGSEDEGLDDVEMQEPDGETQLVTECWVEPQHGLVSGSPKQRSHLEGLPYNRIADAICKVDAECISSLLTYEHLHLMAAQLHVQPPPTCKVLEILSRYGDEVPVWSEPRIRCLPFAYNLTALLPKCQLAELLFSMFIQDLNCSGDVSAGLQQDPDAPNNLLLSIFLQQLATLHDREIPLSSEDSKGLLEQLLLRSRPENAPPLSFLRSENSDKTKSGPRWRCFLKGKKSGRILLTMVPASYMDLKLLMMPDTHALRSNGIKLLHHESSAVENEECGCDYSECHLPISSPRASIDTPLSRFTPLTPIPPYGPQSTANCDSTFLLNHFSRRLRSSEADGSSSFGLVDSPFRMRASSWDPKSGPSTSVKRARTSSMGAKSKPARIDSGSVLPHPKAESSPLQTWQLPMAESMDAGLDAKLSYQRSLSCQTTLSTQESKEAFRLRTQSMDSKRGGFHHRKRSCSIDSKTRFSKKRAASGHGSFQRTQTAQVDTTRTPKNDKSSDHSGNSMTGRCRLPLFGSVTLPLYVLDCPLSSLLESLLEGCENKPADIFEDRTFKWDGPEGLNTTINATINISNSGRAASCPQTSESPEPKSEESDGVHDLPRLQQLCQALSVSYNKCFVLAVFESLHTNLWIHAVDVQAAIDECEECLVEVDITQFLQTVCGHLLEMNRRSSSVAAVSENEVDLEGSAFAHNLVVQRSQRCQDMKLLHRLIKDKFKTILGVAFQPIPNRPQFYFCSPVWDNKRLTDDEVGALQPGALTSLNFHSDIMSLPLQGEVDSIPGLGVAGWDGVLSVTTPDDAHTSLLSNMDSNSMSELVDETQVVGEVSPLFLHLVCSVHAQGDMGSYSIKNLPTCLSELVTALGADGIHLPSENFQVTLDILCLTLPKDTELMYFNDNSRNCTSPMLLGTSSINDSQSSIEERSSSDQLGHLPEYQQKAVTSLVDELKWLMKDEMAACMLDESPVREDILVMVSDHITHSPSRSTCLLEVVPLHFVYEVEQCLQKFRQELSNLRVNGYRTEVEGSFFYLVKDQQVSDDNINSKTREKRDTLSSTDHDKESKEIDNNSSKNQQVNDPIQKPPQEVEESKEEATAENTSQPPSDASDGQTQCSATPDVCSQWLCSPLPRGSGGSDSQMNPPLGTPMKKGVITGLILALDSSKIATSPLKDKHLVGGFQVCDGSSLLSSRPTQDGDICNWSDAAARHSEVSSLLGSGLGTEDGYEGGSSDSGQDCAWLLELEQRRVNLPNFWLILRVEGEDVVVRFHCRFLDMETEEVSSYRAVFSVVLDKLREMVRRVNQTILLHALHESHQCDLLLEPEQGEDVWIHGELTLQRLRSHEDSHDQDQATAEGSAAGHSSKFPPGHFACDIVWERHFILHPRLKTGPGKSGFSRGIQALKSVLNRFCVNNRRNMFVYKDNRGDVFYLRLHENQRENANPRSMAKISAPPGPAPIIDTGDTSPYSVSRSSSIASFNSRRPQPSDDLSSSSVSQSGEPRMRVRSFGEKESIVLLGSSSGSGSAPPIREDYITLRVHGITNAGVEIQNDLVQVLQNRLDDAVLEMLSVMLARNPMCKLSPEDVHFIQRPYHPPETIVQFSVPDHAKLHVQALTYYLHQTLQQFLHQPKYTEQQHHSHFQDYSQLPDSACRVPNSYMYLYNQTPISGSRGIACISMGIMDKEGKLMINSASYRKPQVWAHAEAPTPDRFSSLTSLKRHWVIPPPGSEQEASPEFEAEARVQFGVWKQGRVNMDHLVTKLEAAVRHALWDLLTEFTILTAPIEEPVSPTETAESAESSTDKEILRQLHPVYHTSMQPWLEFAVELGVPSVRKHCVKLASRHALAVSIRELKVMIMTHAKDTATHVFGEVCDSGSKKFLTWRENQENEPTRCLLLTRNEAQWRAFVSGSQATSNKNDAKVSNKVVQKFIPLLGNSPNDNKFVPRQRFLLTVVTSREIVLLVYNWSKDMVESLIWLTTQLGNWLSARSSLLTSIICQKMGLFHNQAMMRGSAVPVPSSGTVTPGSTSTTTSVSSPPSQGNPFMAHLGDIELLTKFPLKESLGGPRRAGSSNSLGAPMGWSGGSLSNRQHEMHFLSNSSINSTSTPSLPVDTLLKVFRDRRPAPLSDNPSDIVVRHARQMLATIQQDKHAEQQRKLNIMWQNRGASPNIPLAIDVLQLFLQHARTIHYCLTPLLFLPRWRVDSAATRDHSLSISPPVPSTESHAKTASRNSLPWMQRRSSSNSGLDKWHQTLCTNFINKYQQYLQETLGFIPIQTEIPVNKRTNNQSQGVCREQQCHYLQKSLLGGVLLVELLLSEPFFQSRLHALECSRIQTKSSNLISQFTLSFLEECDRVKVLLHLHSFTYDFHLRCLHSCVTGRSSLLPSGYHLTLFLDDFIKYYPKAPNFARNLVHADNMSVSNIKTPAQQLFDYLLSHNKVYGMEVFHMVPVTYDFDCDTDQSRTQNEFVLVQRKNTPYITYKDVHDMKQTDDFDVTLIVSHDSVTNAQDPSKLCLKYYIILTSRRELYPKPEIERRHGKFRTVSTAQLPTVSTPPPPPPQPVSDSPSSEVTNPTPQEDTQEENLQQISSVASGAETESSSLTKSPSSASLPKVETLEVLAPQEQSEAVDVPSDTNRLPSPASEATPDICSALSSLESRSTGFNPAPPQVGESSSSTSDSADHLNSTHHVEIRQEAVNYIGFYTSHEQLMQQLIMEQAASARCHIETMVKQGAVHCRTHLLWTRLMCPGSSLRSYRRDDSSYRERERENQSLSYAEFVELLRLARLESLSSIDSRLTPFLTQPLSWYHGLARVLLCKYADHNRQFNAPDGSIQHIAILHPRYLDAFVMLSIDTQTGRGDLAVVYRKPPESLQAQTDADAGMGNLSDVGGIHFLVEGLVNACCFHLWVGML